MAEPMLEYNDLRAIQVRRRQLRKEIRAEGETITRLRHQLLRKDNRPRRKGLHLSFGSMLTAGAGILDGALLAWKLYRKFKKK